VAIKIFSLENQKSINWSGGKTTELFIFPEKSKFENRDFEIRISAATIEVEESNFTPLPGYRRKIMVLEGELHLIHENHHSIKLQRFNQDSFSGDWKTTSSGKVTDFNVIYRPQFEPIVEFIELKEFQSFKFEDNESAFFYVFQGSISMDGKCILEKTFVSIKYESRFSIRAEAETKLILVKF